MSSIHTDARIGRSSSAARHRGHSSGSPVDESAEVLAQTRLAVARAKEGDRGALCFLYSRYSPNIYGYVRSIVHDDHEAEDITQDVFAKLMTVIVKYDEWGVPFFAWLARLARNTAIDHMRANRATPFESVHDPNLADDATVDAMFTVREALTSLPHDQRDVLLLRHVVGLSPPEIAARMGRSEGSIHGLHHRGRRTLKRELARLESTPATRPLTAVPRRPARGAPSETAAPVAA